jgi:uncharacterized protein (DUF3084 family)
MLEKALEEKNDAYKKATAVEADLELIRMLYGEDTRELQAQLRRMNGDIYALRHDIRVSTARAAAANEEVNKARVRADQAQIDTEKARDEVRAMNSELKASKEEVIKITKQLIDLQDWANHMHQLFKTMP